MTFSATQTAALSGPLHAQHVKSRTQAGRSLSYVEAWHAIAEANRIFGYAEWDRETVETRCVAERERKIGAQGKDGWAVSYICKVRVKVFDADGSEVVREGTGAGHGIDVDLGLAHESAIKESESDAMKRALMTFGNPFGLALYDKTQAGVTTARAPPRAIEDSAGRSDLPESGPSGRKSSAQCKRDGDDAKIKADIAKCDAAGLRDWHENFDSYTSHLPISWLDSIRDMLEHRLEDLNGGPGADAHAEMDEAFRQTVDRGSAAGVARGNGHGQSAAA